jgi:hypothetical protein
MKITRVHFVDTIDVQDATTKAIVHNKISLSKQLLGRQVREEATLSVSQLHISQRNPLHTAVRVTRGHFEGTIDVQDGTMWANVLNKTPLSKQPKSKQVQEEATFSV